MKALEINEELAAAVSRVSTLYSSLPEHRRPNVGTGRWLVLEGEIDQACSTGDRDYGLAAIDHWERFAEETIEDAA